MFSKTEKTDSCIEELVSSSRVKLTASVGVQADGSLVQPVSNGRSHADGSRFKPSTNDGSQEHGACGWDEPEASGVDQADYSSGRMVKPEASGACRVDGRRVKQEAICGDQLDGRLFNPRASYGELTCCIGDQEDGRSWPQKRQKGSESFEKQHQNLELFIIKNWVFLKENSNAITWKKKFLTKDLISDRDVNEWGTNLKRSELAEWLMIKTLQKVKTLGDIRLIESVVCEDVMNRLKRDGHYSQRESTENLAEAKEILFNNWNKIVQILTVHDAVTMKDHLLQNQCIDLKENEKLLYLHQSLSSRNWVSEVMGIIKNKLRLENRYYLSFTQSLERISCLKRRQRITELLNNKLIHDSMNSGSEDIQIRNMQSIFYNKDIGEADNLLMKIEATDDKGQDVSTVYKRLTQNPEKMNTIITSCFAALPKKTSEGSLIIHFQMVERNMQDYIKECLKKGRVTTVVQMLFSKIGMQDIISLGQLTLKVKVELDAYSEFPEIVSDNSVGVMKFLLDNRTFLLEEMDTDAMAEGLMEIGIIIPPDVSCIERKEKANQIIHFALTNHFEEKVLDVIKMNKQERFCYLRNRLVTYETVYKADPSFLRKNIFIKFAQIVEEIDIDDIRDILLERNAIKKHTLSDIDDRFMNDKDIAISTLLLKILKSDHAVRAFVDALFVIRWSHAENILKWQNELIVVEQDSKVEICDSSSKDNQLFEGRFNIFIEKRVNYSSIVVPTSPRTNQLTRHEVVSYRMDNDDKNRYFIVGSVFLEIVTPVFQQKLGKKYQDLNYRLLKDFLDHKAVLHNLFHLRHRNAWCCTDKPNCTNRGFIPLNHHQWKQLYAEKPGLRLHNCFCKFTAKSVKPEDLDVSLCGLILFNCCNLGQRDQDAVHILRRYKNDHLSHNTTCGITKDEYDPLMDELKTNILQLDQTKEDELIRIQKRPLDDALCNKYTPILLDIHDMLNKIETRTDFSTNQILDTLNTNNAGLIAKIEELMQKVVCQTCREKLDKNVIKNEAIKPYKLGHSIFALHHQIDLSSVVSGDWSNKVADIVMMDDGRLVICLPLQNRLLICDTDGSQVDSIHVQGQPWYVTAVNNSTVAITLRYSSCIELYDINNKLKLKSISVPVIGCNEIKTAINNKLVVGGNSKLLIIDHQTGEVVQTMKTDCDPKGLHCSGERIFYFGRNYFNKLYWYSKTDDRHHTLTLPSSARRMTTLQDGSLYVVCEDGSVQHVSSDCQHFQTVTTQGLQNMKYFWITYNLKQRKLATRDQMFTFKIYEQ